MRRAGKPEQNQSSWTSFTVRKERSTADLNIQDPIPKIEQEEDTTFSGSLDWSNFTPAELTLSRLSYFPHSYGHCGGWMWREKGQRTEASTPIKRMVHYDRKSWAHSSYYKKTNCALLSVFYVCVCLPYASKGCMHLTEPLTCANTLSEIMLSRGKLFHTNLISKHWALNSLLSILFSLSKWIYCDPPSC